MCSSDLNKILLHLKEFSNAVSSTASLNKFFYELHELCNTAKIERIATLPEDFMVKDLAAQLNDRSHALKLQMLGIKTMDQNLKFSEFEDEIKNIDLVKKILHVMGKSENMIEYVKDRPGHDRRYSTDITKIKDNLFWTPMFSLEIGRAHV